MTLRCLLIDDEPPALKVLRHHLANIPGTTVVASCNNVFEAFEVLQKDVVDLIFLDIKMPSMLGTDFIKSLRFPPKVIFVTAYPDFAIEGYELDVIDYLMKPVSFERFVKAIVKAKRIIGLEQPVARTEQAMESNGFVYLKVDRSMQKVMIREIVFIESWKDYVKVTLTTGKTLLVKQSISSTEMMLSSQQFLRVHRSYIVAMDKLKGYTANHVLVAQHEIPIGRMYKQNVFDQLKYH